MNEMTHVAFKTVAPEWGHIPHVSAFTTCTTPDDPVNFSGESEMAQENRQLLESAIAPDTPIHWMTQVHGNTVVLLPQEATMEADGAVAHSVRTVCAVRTADCVPVVVTTTGGDRVGVAHAGWRGLARGVIEETVRRLRSNPSDTHAWLGPAIAGTSYEVGEEVHDAFDDYRGIGAFTQGREKQKYFCDMYIVARNILSRIGVPSEHISGGTYDTYNDLRFHSARREGEGYGHMATIAWFE